MEFRKMKKKRKRFGRRVAAIMLATALVVTGTDLSAFSIKAEAESDTTNPETTNSFKITGGTEGTDYTFAQSDTTGATLTIKSSTPLTISGGTADSSITGQIKIAESVKADLTLNGLYLTGVGASSDNTSKNAVSAIDLTATSELTLTLAADSENKLTGGTTPDNGIGGNGIHVPKGATLTIQGSGKLEVRGGSNIAGYSGTEGVGIGGAGSSDGNGESCGTVVIAGGTVTVTGGISAVGIGGGSGGSDGSGGAGGTVEITGGEVTVTGGTSAVGIGGGSGGSAGNGGDGGTVMITGGEVTVTGGTSAAGIGGGDGSGVYGSGSSGGSGGTVVITGGTVSVTGGNTNAGGICGGFGSTGQRNTTGTAVVLGANVTVSKISKNYFSASILPANDGYALSGQLTLPTLVSEYTIPAGKTLTCSSGSLTIPAKVTLNIESGVTLSEGITITNNGTVKIDCRNNNYDTLATAIQGDGTVEKVHNWENGVCKNGCGDTHDHDDATDWANKDGICITCGGTHEHKESDWANKDGVCITCGMAHIHADSDWTYTKRTAENTIIAACDVCKKEVVFTLMAPTENLTYDGTEKTATVTMNPDGVLTAPEITYSKNGNVNAGEVTASIGLGDVTASVPYTIAPRDASSATVGISGTYTYTGSAIVPDANNVSVKLGGKTLVYDTDYTFTASDNVNVGTATVTVNFEGNYSGSATGTFTIDKADSAATAPNANSLTYTGSEQALVTADTVTGGTLMYSLEEDGTYTAEIPTGKNAGEYTVWYYVKGDNNHKDTGKKHVTVNIAKAEKVPNMPGSVMIPANSKETVGDVGLPIGWEWSEGDKNTAMEVGIPVTASAIYGGTDKGNYKTETVIITLTRSKCAHENTEIKNKEDATCEKTGKTGDIVCTICEEIISSSVEIPLADHKGGMATCIKQAECEVCGASYGELDSSNHVNTEIRDKVNATSTTAGYTGDTYCNDCKKTIKTGAVIPATGSGNSGGSSSGGSSSGGGSGSDGSSGGSSGGTTVPVVPPSPVMPSSEPIQPTEPVVTPTEPVVTPTEPVVTPTEPVATPTEPVVTPTEPTISEEPSATTTPSADENPAGTTAPAVSQTPTVIPTLEATQQPVTTQTPAPEKTAEPVITPAPEKTAEPDKKEEQGSKLPKKGTEVTDDKKVAKYVISSQTKKEVTYIAPINKKAKTITIPATIKVNGISCKVTKIGDNAFKNNKKITKITIGSNVKTIGKNAFKGLTKSTTIKVPKKKLAFYKKLFKSKGLSSKVKVKGF